MTAGSTNNSTHKHTTPKKRKKTQQQQTLTSSSFYDLVIYDACPRSFDSGIWFDRTLYGLTTAKDCPIGSLGQAYKTCDKEVGWLPADLFNCTSLPFVDLRETVCCNVNKRKTRDGRQ